MVFNYKHELDFLGSGNLKEDLYSVVKIELSDYLHQKYKIYLDSFCEEDDINIAKFYSEYYQLLNRLSIISKNKTIKTFNDYFITIVRSSNQKLSNELNTLATILREFDDLINGFTYAIISNVNEFKSKYDLNHGVYSLINQYFGFNSFKNFESFSGLLEGLYNITYRVMRLKYKENKYGKK